MRKRESLFLSLKYNWSTGLPSFATAIAAPFPWLKWYFQDPHYIFSPSSVSFVTAQAQCHSIFYHHVLHLSGSFASSVLPAASISYRSTAERLPSQLWYWNALCNSLYGCQSLFCMISQAFCLVASLHPSASSCYMDHSQTEACCWKKCLHLRWIMLPTLLH